MCLGAIYWARLQEIYRASTREDAAQVGFDDDAFYKELVLPPAKRQISMKSLLRSEGQETLKLWLNNPNQMAY